MIYGSAVEMPSLILEGREFRRAWRRLPWRERRRIRVLASHGNRAADIKTAAATTAYARWRSGQPPWALIVALTTGFGAFGLQVVNLISHGWWLMFSAASLVGVLVYTIWDHGRGPGLWAEAASVNGDYVEELLAGSAPVSDRGAPAGSR